MAIVFTCTAEIETKEQVKRSCGTRAVRMFTKHAYHHGVVLVRCPQCESLHLIADRLGYFGDESMDVEKLMALKGESVKTVTNENVLEITAHDVAGQSTELV